MSSRENLVNDTIEWLAAGSENAEEELVNIFRAAGNPREYSTSVIVLSEKLALAYQWKEVAARFLRMAPEESDVDTNKNAWKARFGMMDAVCLGLFQHIIAVQHENKRAGYA